MRGGSSRAIVRLALRDSLRNCGRSALVIALIALPVLVLAVGDIAYRTWQISPAERITRQIGSAQAGIRWEGAPVVQTPGAWLGGWTTLSDSPNTSASTFAPPDFTSALPAGSRVIEQVTGAAPLQFRTLSGIGEAETIGLDYQDPIAHGLIKQISGKAPLRIGQAAVSTALAHSDGLRLGSQLSVVGANSRLTVVGLVRDTSYRDDQNIYALPATVQGLSSQVGATAAPSATGGQTTWLIGAAKGVTWSQVQALNKMGYLVLSRQVFLHPPAKAGIESGEVNVPNIEPSTFEGVLAKEASHASDGLSSLTSVPHDFIPASPTFSPTSGGLVILGAIGATLLAKKLGLGP